jgi:hypothetical protein
MERVEEDIAEISEDSQFLAIILPRRRSRFTSHRQSIDPSEADRQLNPPNNSVKDINFNAIVTK